jgi:hypothetical protein
MTPLTALWLPILLSAVIVFFASAIMHMVLAYHKSDYRKLPDEDRVSDALRSAGVTRGPAYFFPYFSFKELKSAPAIEKMKRGPVGLLTVLPSGPPAMGKNLVQWFLYCVVISTSPLIFPVVRLRRGPHSHKSSALLVSPLCWDTAQLTSRNRSGAAEAGSSH